MSKMTCRDLCGISWQMSQLLATPAPNKVNYPSTFQQPDVCMAITKLGSHKACLSLSCLPLVIQGCFCLVRSFIYDGRVGQPANRTQVSVWNHVKQIFKGYHQQQALRITTEETSGGSKNVMLMPPADGNFWDNKGSLQFIHI